MSIATVIITKNESENIKNCIEQVLSFSDEIIIVDSFSTDDTKLKALSFPKVKFYERTFDDYISQKNYANSLVNSDYILSLDADEYPSPELILFLESANYKVYDSISFKRINLFAGKFIRFGLWKKDIKIRFWKKGLAQWAGSIPHEHLLLEKGVNTFHSTHTIFHKAYSTYDDLYYKSLKYAKLYADRNQSKGIVQLFFSLILNPVFKFVKGYLFLQGFRDGKYGWYIAKVSFIETCFKYYLALKNKWRKK